MLRACSSSNIGLARGSAAAANLLALQCSRRQVVVQCLSTNAPSSSSSSSSPARPAAAAAAAAQVAVKGTFLDSLSSEQQDAVLAQEQHIRVIAGPGSGKTRTVAARVAWLLEQGVSPRSILVITFTRKAAAELKDRLSADTGKLPYGLTAGTFHSLCSNILWGSQLAGKADWSVADEDDCSSIIKGILEPKPEEEEGQQQAAAAAEAQPAALSSSDEDDSGSSSKAQAGTVRSSRSRSRVKAGTSSSPAATTSSSSSKGKSKAKAPAKSSSRNSSSEAGGEEVNANMFSYFRKQISAMKNFVESTHSGGQRKRGAEIIAELASAGETRFARLNPQQAASLASVFDQYQQKLVWQKLMDFDDLLHHCLALLHDHPEVATKLHSRWQHVLVDEGQDTNLCQFELVRQLTGPHSKLFMVGDPDQAIYGFRGAKSSMLQEQFNRVYAGSAATFYLSDNYRSRPPIVMLGDSIRKHLRPSSHKLVRGRSMRRDDGPCVTLQAARTEQEEYACVVEQLKAWHRQGYAWDDMAVLARNKLQVKFVYSRALERGIPCHLQVGDFWDALEVKVALSLLRAVVYPVAASEGIKKRLIKTSPEVKVPLTAGLGPKPIEAMESVILAANLARDRSSSSSSSTNSGSSSSPGITPGDDIPSSLSGCLLAGCGLGSLTQQEAAAVKQRWQDALDADRDGMEVLRGLAPAWQQLPGLKALSKGQLAGVERLRGLVQLAAASAALGDPVPDIVQLLLEASGMVEALEQVIDEGRTPEKVNRARGRVNRLRTLATLASLPDFQGDADDMYRALQRYDLDSDEWPDLYSSSDGGDGSDLQSSLQSGNGGDGSSSSSAPQDSSPQLRAFMDYCSLQGDNDGEAAQEHGPRASFLTMHASKGKEFACVALPAFYQGVLPTSRLDHPTALEQERNTAFVAVTRAKDRLLVTWPETVFAPKAGFMSTQVSQFLTEAVGLARAGRLPGVELVGLDE